MKMNNFIEFLKNRRAIIMINTTNIKLLHYTVYFHLVGFHLCGYEKVTFPISSEPLGQFQANLTQRNFR